MSSTALYRWCAVAIIAGGILEVLITTLEYVWVPDGAFSVQASSPAWGVQQVMNWAAKLLLLWGLVGMYAREAAVAGRLGFVAFIVAFAGTALEFAAVWGFAFVAWGLAASEPSVLDSFVDRVPILIGIFVPFVSMAIGWTLFALASLRANVLPRLGLVLVAIGPLLFFLGLHQIPDVLYGTGLVVVGSSFWTAGPAPSRSETVTAVASGI